MLNIPKLRFPGFSGEWQVKKLGDLISRLDAGVSVNSEDRRAMHGEYAILKTSCVTKGIFDPNENKAVTAEVEIDRLKEAVQINTIVISRMNTPQLVGANALVTENFSRLYLPDRLWGGKISKDASVKWVALIVGSNKYRVRLSELATGTSNSMKNITKGDVLNMQVRTPSLQEQEMIAEFMGGVDDIMRMLQSKVAAMDEYKKGVMQSLFSGRLRFKDRNDTPYPDWQIKKLGELCKTAKSGGTPTATNRAYYVNGTIPFLAISDITAQGKYLTKTSKFITKEGLANSASWLVPENSLIYSMYASVGLPAINKIALATSQAVIILIPNQYSTVDFLYYFLLNYQSRIHRLVETGTQGNLNAQTVKSIEVKLPSIAEQQKIADFLTSIDDKISIEEAKLERAKLYKRSLLQRMFV